MLRQQKQQQQQCLCLLAAVVLLQHHVRQVGVYAARTAALLNCFKQSAAAAGVTAA
jgi:hypothetical protein